MATTSIHHAPSHKHWTLNEQFNANLSLSLKWWMRIILTSSCQVFARRARHADHGVFRSRVCHHVWRSLKTRKTCRVHDDTTLFIGQHGLGSRLENYEHTDNVHFQNLPEIGLVVFFRWLEVSLENKIENSWPVLRQEESRGVLQDTV